MRVIPPAAWKMPVPICKRAGRQKVERNMPISKGIRVIVKRFLRVWRKENSSRHIVDRGEFLQSDSQPLSSWIKSQIESEKYWFHAMELPGGMVTPGWSNPRTDKLPFFGLPDEMHGLGYSTSVTLRDFSPSKRNGVGRRKSLRLKRTRL